MPKDKVCARCRNVFTPPLARERYCATCRIAVNLKRIQEGRPGSGGNQRGAKNNMWKGGYTSFRQVKLESLNGVYVCERCGENLQEKIASGKKGLWAVHHKDRDRNNPALENLELLCKRCHQIEHECWKNYTK